MSEAPNLVNLPTPNDSTYLEPWSRHREDHHWYAKQVDYAISRLGRGPGECLVIGSPLFEANELAARGWNVTYNDVREPPEGDYFFIRGDAGEVHFPEAFFDAASSTCVLCHAGLGRYGDPIRERGDIAIVENLHRALKSRARAAITFGPVYTLNETHRHGRMHRIYTLEDAENMVKGFKILEKRILDIRTNDWVERVNRENVVDINYLSMFLEKP